MKAKEMFERMGYELIDQYPYYMFYSKQFRTDEEDEEEGVVRAMDLYHIEFNYQRKIINKSYGNDNTMADITMDELKAINKQCEELGWL